MRAAETVLAFVLILVATESGSVLLAGGVLRQLHAWTLLVVALVWALVVGLLTIAPAHRRRVAERRRALRATAVSVLPFLRRHPVLAVLAVLVTVQYGWRLLVALRFPMLDFDGLWYHLTTVDLWRQYHAVTRVRVNIWSDAYPAGSETVTAWLVVLRGGVSVATLAQFQFVALGVAAVVALCRRAGLSVSAAVFAGLVFAATPIVFVQAPSGEVDVAAAATLVAAWYLLATALLASERRLAPVLLAGVAVGLTAGVKTTGLVAVGVMLLGAVVILLRTRHRSAVRPAWWWAVAVVGLLGPFLGYGGWWYVADWVAHGNPVYPLPIAGLPGLAWAGRYAHILPPHHHGPLAAIWASWTTVGWHPLGTTARLGGFGLQFLPLLALAVAGAVALVRVHAGRRQLALTLLPAALLFGLYPDRWMTRYVIFLVVVVAFLTAVLVSRLRPRLRTAVQAALVACIAFSMAAATYYPNANVGRHLTMGRVWRLMWSSAQTRASVGWWGYYRALAKLPDGAILVPPDANRLPYPPIFLAPLVGQDFDRQLVAVGTEPVNGTEVLRLLRQNDARYLLVYTGSTLGDYLATSGEMALVARFPDAVMYAPWTTSAPRTTPRHLVTAVGRDQPRR